MSAKASLPDFQLPEQRIIELAGAQWVGLQRTDSGILYLFRDPVTGSSCSLPEQGLTVSSVLAKLQAKREQFGVVLS